MNKQSALAMAVAAAVGGASTGAQAAPYTATLKSVTSYAGAGSSVGNITSSTATWSYDDATNLLTSTGGVFNVRFTITPTTTLFRHSIAGLVIGNAGAASATTYTCTEGNFGGNVGASLCGNYNFGANFANESTVTWGPGTTFARTLGGDDMALGPQQNNSAYDYFALVSWTGTTLTLRNASCNPFAPGNASGCATTGGFNTGYTWTLEAGPQVAPPVVNPDTATAESGVATGINVLANDTGLTGTITVTIATPPANGTAVVNVDNTITYTSNGGFTGSDPFTYNVVADNLVSPGANGTVTVTVIDTVPDAFTFNSLTDQPLNTQVQSNTINITGLGQAVAVSIADGEYSVGCSGTFTNAAGTINNGPVCVRQTTSASPSTAKVTTLTVGGGSGTFTTTTEAADTTPNAFSFDAQTGVTPGTQVTSNTVTLSGTNVPVPISVSAGGEYSIGCTSTFTAAAGNINPGESVCVRQTASADPLTQTDATLTISGVAATFSVTTADVIPVTTPEPFQFVDQPNVPLDTVITSEPVTITGITVPVPITVQNGTYSIGCTDTFTAAPGTISPGETVCVQQTSASTSRTAVTTILSVGDPAVSDAFSSGTGGGGGSSSMDGLMTGVLGLLGLARLRRKGR